MFTIRAWNLTEGFDNTIANAIDYDIYLKLSEVGEFKHINKISYNRVIHGENTSVRKMDIQKKNHFHVLNQFCYRQGIPYEVIPRDEVKDSRLVDFKKIEG